MRRRTGITATRTADAREGRVLTPSCVAATKERPFERLPLSTLIDNLARTADADLVRELHDHRRVVSADGERAMRIVEQLNELRGYSRRATTDDRARHCSDYAYYLTLARLGCPLVDPPNAHSRRGVDSRKYFKALSGLIGNWQKAQPDTDRLAAERGAAIILGRFVTHQYNWAIKEARRHSNPARSRFAWRLPSGIIWVWFPTWVPGRDRSAWLEKLARDPDPRRPGETERVQELVDAALGVPVHHSDCHLGDLPSTGEDADCPVAAAIQAEIREKGLAVTIAEEKAASLQAQRLTIRQLGSATVRSLVLKIFEAVESDEYDEKRIASSFGLSPATLSRFAGSRWTRNGAGAVPDLWLNLAHVLAQHPVFREVAEGAGLWDAVDQLCSSPQQPRLSRGDHA